MALKDIAKKWGKIAMCGVTLLGATGGMLAANVINQPAMTVQAASANLIKVVTSTGIDMIFEETILVTKYITEDFDGDGVYDHYSDWGSFVSTTLFDPDKNINDPCTFTTARADAETGYDTAYVYEVKRGSNNEVIFASGVIGDSVTVQIIKRADETAPVISGWEGVYYVNYDNPPTLASIISKMSAIDETDGNVTIKTESDAYTGNEKVLGSHIVKLSATDRAGNKSEITIDIRVTDGTKPTISGQSTYTSNMSSPVTESTIRAGLTGRDNYDSNLTVQLVEDNFTGNEQKAGSYTITYKTVDSSGNTSEIFTVTVTNKDDIKPTISGITTYNVASTGVVTSDYIISQLTASDNIDTSGLNIQLVNDGYTDKSTIVGTYQMTFNVTDSSGNVSDLYTVDITVVDDIPPVFWVSKDFFSVDESLTLTHDQIVQVLLAQQGVDQTEVLAYQVVEDNYTANAGTPGVYALSYRLQMKSGEVITLTSNINVVEEEVVTPVEPGEEIKQETKNFFENVWEDVKEFFNKLLKSFVKYILFGWAWDKEGKFDPNWSDWN